MKISGTVIHDVFFMHMVVVMLFEVIIAVLLRSMKYLACLVTLKDRKNSLG